MLYSVSDIMKKLCKILIMEGVSEEDAVCTADALLEADLRGYKSQGMHRIFQILDGFRQKTLLPIDCSNNVRDFDAVTVIDGNKYLGQPLAKKAMSIAIEKSKLYGVGVSGVINAGHIGLLAYYSEQASRAGCIGLVMSTSSPAVVIKGSGQKFLGTNPISFSVPAKESPPITADFSTSKVSRSKVYEYIEANKSLPIDWAVDVNGNPTSSPREALEGGIHTFDSGVKGTSLSLLISILCGPLIGGVMNSHVTGTRYMDKPPNKGDFFLSFCVSKFTEYSRFLEITEEIISFIKQQGSEFRIPGSFSHVRKENATLNGLEVSSELSGLFSKINTGKPYAA